MKMLIGKKYEICNDTIAECLIENTVEYHGLVARYAASPHCTYPPVEYEVICTVCFKEVYLLNVQAQDICHSCRTADD